MFVFAKNYEEHNKGPRSKNVHEATSCRCAKTHSNGCLTPFRSHSFFSLAVFLIDLQP